MEDPKKSHIDEANGFSLIDGSTSDDDFLVASSSEANMVDNPGDIIAEGTYRNRSSEFVELQIPIKKDKCNLRKSLAWDSAFFTSAGVLDANELSSIIEGSENGVKQKHFLLGIQEDLSKSTDSISTFESDNLTLGSLEADLFCDIRASIQRCTKPSALVKCGNTEVLGQAASTNGCPPKLVEASSGYMVKPKLASKKHNPGIKGPLKALKTDSSGKQVSKPAVKSRVSSSLIPRPPEAADKPSLIVAATTKRMSAGVPRVKLESSTAGNSKGKGALFPKVSHQADSRNTVQKIMVSAKISSSSSVLNRTSLSSSSESIHKTQSEVIKRKMEKNANVPSGSKIRTPSRVAVKSKSRTGGESHVTAYLKSTPKVSSSISPASSISDWSTESSFSTASVSQNYIGLKPCPPSSSEDTIVDCNVSRNSPNHSSSRREKEVARSLSQLAKQPLAVSAAVSLPRPASAKPSSLRMPSPKIGFFDGVKVGHKTPTGGSKSHSSSLSSLPRPVAGNRTKLGNIPAKKTTTGTPKPDPRRTNPNLKLAEHLEDQSTGLREPSSSKNGASDSNTSSEIQESISSTSALERNTNIVVPEKEASPVGKSYSTIDLITLAAKDGSKIVDITTDCMKNVCVCPSSKVDQRNRSNTNTLDDLNPSQELHESCDHKVVGIYACQDGSVAHGATNDSQDLGQSTMEDDPDAYVENQVDGLNIDIHMKTRDHKIETQGESDGSFYSHNIVKNKVNSSSILSCPKESYYNETTEFPRTPFAVKNSVCDVVEACNSSTTSALESLVKVNALHYLENVQKENS